jgi:1-aminocyclopropane-1-carboxylate deaminase/D-cysteine desulfhydrase-like pyridoxal-dependent ACC family enzyme
VSEAYQNFLPKQPRVRLAAMPSPLERAARLESALRAAGAASVPRVFLKRDDVLTLGLGGNKIRNLEFSLARAFDDGATDIVTSGRAQSNHCRLTAAACARLGLGAHLVFSGIRPERLTGNLLLDELLGARLYFCGSDSREDRAKWTEVMALGVEMLGHRPCIIPVGGSVACGAIGHALAALELAEQMRAIGERLSAVVLATATGGTQAGMLVGFGKMRLDVPVYGYAVAKSANELRLDVQRLASEVAVEMNAPSVAARDVLIDDGQLGGGYGIRTEAAQAAIELLARNEGVFADPVYTGKALAGLFRLVHDRRFQDGDAVVFIHTGGAPALFA